MAKAYWVNTYRIVTNPDALVAYAKIAGPALLAAGGRFVVRGVPAKVYESGMNQRTVVIEFDSLAQATAAHDSPGYQQALGVLGDAAVRDFRIVEGVSDSPGFQKGATPKGYMVGTYRSVKKPEALEAYAKIAGPAVMAAGARFLVRGNPSKVYEHGMMQRTVVVEFDSVKAVIAAYDGPAYAEALKALGKDAAVRDMRVVEAAA